MSERFKAKVNENDSKNTRLDVAGEFSGYRFGRDALAHVSRYLLLVENMIEMSKQLGRPIRVLDVGCGDVYLARVLQASFAVKKTAVVERYVGFDIDDERLARTEKTKPKSFPIELELGDVTTGGLARFADKTFDLLVCTEVLEHIQPQFVPVVLSEFRRVATRGLISTPNFTGGTGQLPDDHVKEWDCAELTQTMEAAGIVVRSRTGIFSNLTKVRKLAEANVRLKETLDFLTPRMDAHLLSLTMARFVGIHAQNVLYDCEFPG